MLAGCLVEQPVTQLEYVIRTAQAVYLSSCKGTALQEVMGIDACRGKALQEVVGIDACRGKALQEVVGMDACGQRYVQTKALSSPDMQSKT